MAIYWPTPGFKGTKFKLCVLTRWDFNLCVRSSPLRGRLSELRRLWPSVLWRAACDLVCWWVPTPCLDSGIVSPLRLCWVKSVCVFRCNLPLAPLAEWPGSFTCHCGNTVVERTPNNSQHTVNTGEENSPAAPAGIRTRNLSITSPALLPTSHPVERTRHRQIQRQLFLFVFVSVTRLWWKTRILHTAITQTHREHSGNGRVADRRWGSSTCGSCSWPVKRPRPPCSPAEDIENNAWAVMPVTSSEARQAWWQSKCVQLKILVQP